MQKDYYCNSKLQFNHEVKDAKSFGIYYSLKTKVRVKIECL